MFGVIPRKKKPEKKSSKSVQISMKIVENDDLSQKFEQKYEKSSTIFSNTGYFEFGAVRRCVNPVDLEKW